MIYGTDNNTDDDDNDATEDKRIKRELIELKTNRENHLYSNVVNVFLFYVWFFFIRTYPGACSSAALQFVILFLAHAAVWHVSHVA